MAIQTERKMTVAEYLEWEARQELKHEYIDGDIIEMTGGSGKHSKIPINITLALGGRIELSSYVIFNSEMRVRVGAACYVYPDLGIVRSEEIYEDESELTLLNPVFVVEVVSPTSQTRDRVDKPDLYFDAPSIEAYLIVDQDRPRADLYTRTSEGWHVRMFSNEDDVIPLPMLNCELPLAQVYRGIEFAEA
jgi:Uma2 family endonuclease